MEKSNQLEFNQIRYQVNVKLSPIDYKRLYKEHRKTGRSMPSLLRDSFLNRLPTKFLLKPEQGDKLIKEINRLGVNINQIARRVNAGVGYGWSEGITKCYETLDSMKRMCVGAYGNS
tara:strand:- start:155 stop:505 length:351 start_codon:yes stop_codon:yes gene_type:complete